MFGLLTILVSSLSWAGGVYEKLPDKINSADRFLLYSHGYIVEGENPRPIETKFGWGGYDLPAIKEALAGKKWIREKTNIE
jgi:hypothetical protein